MDQPDNQDKIEQAPPEVEQEQPPQKIGNWESVVRKVLRAEQPIEMLDKYLVTGSATERLKTVAVRQAMMTDLFAGQMLMLMNKVNALQGEISMLRDQMRTDIPEMTGEIDAVNRKADDAITNIQKTMAATKQFGQTVQAAVVNCSPIISKTLWGMLEQAGIRLAYDTWSYDRSIAPIEPLEPTRGDNEKSTDNQQSAEGNEKEGGDPAEVSGDSESIQSLGGCGYQAGDSAAEVSKDILDETQGDQERAGDNEKPE